MTTTLIDYGAGNLHSVANSFRAAGGNIVTTQDPEIVRNSDRIILPGVGAFHDCRRGLDAATGMIEAMEHAVFKRGVPFLGVCVGMQLLAQEGDEHGQLTKGLGWISGRVTALKPKDNSARIPHMGWNEITQTRPHPVLDGLDDDSVDVYFVHSYAIEGTDNKEILATCDYSGPFIAAIGRDNIVGTQFHPEKSQRAGLKLLKNFLNWRP